MTTSGTTDFSLTARQVVIYALRKLRVIGSGESPSADDMAICLEELNVMLKGWQMQGPNLWRQTQGSLPLTSATASYSLPHAYRIISARFRQSGRDLPMELLTREEYFDLPLKTAAGIPTQFYFDPQVASGTLYTWPVLATAAGETIEYTYQRRFEDIDSQANTIDVPQEHLGMVGYTLASRVADDFGVDAKRITDMALLLQQQADSADREPVVRFVPDRRR